MYREPVISKYSNGSQLLISKTALSRKGSTWEDWTGRKYSLYSKRVVQRKRKANFAAADFTCLNTGLEHYKSLAGLPRGTGRTLRSHICSFSGTSAQHAGFYQTVETGDPHRCCCTSLLGFLKFYKRECHVLPITLIKSRNNHELGASSPKPCFKCKVTFRR